MTYADKTLAQIVTEFPVSAALLEKHDLDYCCKGKRTLRDSCESSMKLDSVEAELSSLLDNYLSGLKAKNPEAMTNSELVQYILDKHHVYVKTMMPVIDAHLLKVASKHGTRHPELIDIHRMFTKVMEEMTVHMLKEEEILFPSILAAENRQEISSEVLLTSSFSKPIDVMEKEHEIVGDLLAEIKNLSGKYSPPMDACMTYRLSFEELKDFELDLHQHVHLENNILFPRALELNN